MEEKGERTTHDSRAGHLRVEQEEEEVKGQVIDASL